MAREWGKLLNDEIFGIWGSYLRTEFPNYGDPLCMERPFKQSVRITPMEMIKLIDELILRLSEKKE